jgi:exonuclease SbcC
VIPLKLTLKGFLSYREAETVDLSAVEVACVSGANGAGKSSLFDAITWVLFGRARRSDDTLIHDAADSCSVEMEFAYEENRYRVIREKPRGKGASLEFQVRSADDSWRTLTEAGVRATEDRIRDVLRLDYETFVNASFFLQGKADMFAQQTASKRKEILSSILGLEVWETFREEAARRRREVGSKAEIQRSLLEEIQSELGEEAERKERLALLQTALKNAEAARTADERILANARDRQQEVQAEVEKLSLLEKRVKEAKDELGRNESQIETQQNERDQYDRILKTAGEIEKRYKEWNELRSSLEQMNELVGNFHKLDKQKTELAATIAAEKTRLTQERTNLKEQAAEIQTLSAQLPEMEGAQKVKADEIADLESNISVHAGAEETLLVLQDERAALIAENMRLKTRMDELKGRIDQLEKASGANCPLCGQDLTDAHRTVMVVNLKKEGKGIGDQFRGNTESVKEADRRIAAHQKELTEIRTKRERLAKLQGETTGLTERITDATQRIRGWDSAGKSRLAEVEAALKSGDYAADSRGKLATTDTAIRELGYDEGAHASIQERETAARSVEEEYRTLEKGRTAIEGLQRQLKTLYDSKERMLNEYGEREAELAELKITVDMKAETLPDIAELERSVQAKRIAENRLREDVGGAQQMVDVLDRQREREIEVKDEIQVLNTQTAELRMLEIAFGRDGIQALLIEQALPEIEAQANEVLDRLSDGRMSVSFETERAYKDDKRADKKQTLDILISDSSGRREYELFSGGEAFRINFAIRLALSRVLAGRAGARLQTLVIDEGFGSQDADGRQRLIEAINLVSPDFAKILVITHLDELKDAFPSRIEVRRTETGSRVEVIP